MTDREPFLRSPRPAMGRPSDGVVDVVAAYANTPPEELPPSFDTIDPDALDQLFRSDGRHGRIEFQYGGFTVAVRRNGDVDLTSIDE